MRMLPTKATFSRASSSVYYGREGLASASSHANYKLFALKYI